MSDLASRLEPFLLLARSTKGASAAKVIHDAVSATGVYVFAELLELPNIKQLSGDPNHSKQFNLLQLFAYGTLKDYTDDTDRYPPLTTQQLAKLKHLTLVSLALQHRSLAYAQLSTALQITSVRELEDLIIDVIYAGLLRGKMHHHEKVLHVDWVAGRDVREADLSTIKTGLENWCRTAQTLLDALDSQIDHTLAVTAQKQEDETVYRQKRDNDFAAVVAAMRSEQRPGRERRAAEDLLGITRGDGGSRGGGSGGGLGLGGRREGALFGRS
ncbi:hypothetical protein BCR39DRAFT_540527 [Naematelia encephala]|uniref:PCI domain-containing protein n=1 Tax=Naematelia encephala TaxID=71784 RepID=A0A1Y2AW74_9TREE|nr:hypothetical protein BCR39DRAFT_540527 [Naematelia encephala]